MTARMMRQQPLTIMGMGPLMPRMMPKDEHPSVPGGATARQEISMPITNTPAA